MKIKNIILTAFVAISAFTSCKEDEIDLYSGSPSINIGIINAKENVDTVRTFPFGFIDDRAAEFKVKLYLSGYAASEDRVIDLEFAGNAVEGEDFEMGKKVTLKAGEIETVTTCKIIRSANLANGALDLIINVKPNQSFQKSVMNTVRINYSDDVPKDWLNVQYNMGNNYLGECSKVKYLFLYDMTGIYDFASYTYNFVNTLGSFLQGKINDYNANPAAFEIAHGIPTGKYGPSPMVDEKGEPVKYK